MRRHTELAQLTQLRLAGVFERISGLVLGKFVFYTCRRSIA